MSNPAGLFCLHISFLHQECILLPKKKTKNKKGRREKAGCFHDGVEDKPENTILIIKAMKAVVVFCFVLEAGGEKAKAHNTSLTSSS